MTPSARAAAGFARFRRAAARAAHAAVAGAVLAAAAAASPAAARAQQPAPAAASGPIALSLEDALRLAERQSESVRIAETAVLRARGQQSQARAQGLPQLNATGAYQRAIQNQFQELQRRNPQPVRPPSLCAPFVPSGATPEQRAAALAAAESCNQPGAGGGADFTALFANPNTYVVGVSGSQLLFAGGRVRAARSTAAAGRRVADIGVTGARTQVRLDVATAYFDAALAERLVTIAESSFVQTERAYRQTALAREVGNVSEFDLLRARVARDNQRPQLVQARGARATAYLRLRQLLVLPLDEPLRLTTALPLAPGADSASVGAATRAPLEAAGLAPARAPGAPAPAAPARRDSVATTLNARGETTRVRTVNVDPDEVLGDDPRVRRTVDSLVAASDTSGRGRLTTRQSNENVTVQRNLLRVARAQRLPAVQLSSNYQRTAVPVGTGLVVPSSFGTFIPNFTASLGVSLPLLTSGRIRGDVLIAEANLREAQATARQVEQLSSLDARLAVTQLEQAEAAFSASAGTAEQAARAFGIAEVRFREGVATQVELADARLLLQQAQANAAQAARDREVSRLRLALLRDLPLSQVQGGAQAGAGGFGGRQGGGAGQQSVPQPAGRQRDRRRPDRRGRRQRRRRRGRRAARSGRRCGRRARHRRRAVTMRPTDRPTPTDVRDTSTPARRPLPASPMTTPAKPAARTAPTLVAAAVVLAALASCGGGGAPAAAVRRARRRPSRRRPSPSAPRTSSSSNGRRSRAARRSAARSPPSGVATLRAEVGGTVTAIYAEAGQSVRGGQALAARRDRRHRRAGGERALGRRGRGDERRAGPSATPTAPSGSSPRGHRRPRRRAGARRRVGRAPRRRPAAQAQLAVSRRQPRHMRPAPRPSGRGRHALGERRRRRRAGRAALHRRRPVEHAAHRERPRRPARPGARRRGGAVHRHRLPRP
jgi:outer membrane protein TolC/biotin carboxyl carrier protein